MSILKKTLVVAMVVMVCSTAMAQEDADELDEKMREAEQRLVEQEREIAEVHREMEMQRAERERVMHDETIEVDVRMRAAEASLAEAAQQVAELSRRQLPRVEVIERIMRGGRGPVLGVTIGADDDDLDFMQGVEEGDELSIEYLRNGKAQTTEVSPRPMHGGVFAFNFDGQDFSAPGFPVPPNARNFEKFLWVSGGSGLGDMELVKLTERLGSYFGTDEGLLIVRAPQNEELKLQDGE